MTGRRRLPKTVWGLGIVSLLMDLSSEIYHALLPAFLTVTLGLPMVAVGLLDGVSEATANITKLVSGRLSDKQGKRKPWLLLGYGLAALSKPLFPLATSFAPIVGARFMDRIGKGIRGAPRDAMIADATEPSQRGAAYGLRQSLDTVGAFIAPFAAIGLMAYFLGDIRSVFWIAAIPAFLSFAFILAFIRETGTGKPTTAKMAWGGLRGLDAPVQRLLLIGGLFGLARFSESFLILKAIDVGLAIQWSPLVLAGFNLSFGLLAYPAGMLSDKVRPRTILLVGIALLVIADLWLAKATSLTMVAIGVLLWGAHMAFTQGIFARMIADAASDEKRASSFGAFFFTSGIATLFASLGAGAIWDTSGAAVAFTVAAVIAGLSGGLLLLLPDRTPPITS